MPYIKFIARKTEKSVFEWVFGKKPGHSFVVMGTEIDNCNEIDEIVFGYYPRSEDAWTEIKSFFTKVDGKIASMNGVISEEGEKSIRTVDYRDLRHDIIFKVRISEQQQKEIEYIAKKWSNNDPKYNLFANEGKNCNSFAEEVAKVAGLEVKENPSFVIPVDFISALKRDNIKNVGRICGIY